MKELKEYLTPSLCVIIIEENVFTGNSFEQDKDDDPYGDGDNWWENT